MSFLVSQTCQKKKKKAFKSLRNLPKRVFTSQDLVLFFKKVLNFNLKVQLIIHQKQHFIILKTKDNPTHK